MSKKTDSNYLHSNCSDKKIWSDEEPLQQETILKIEIVLSNLSLL